MSEHNDQALEQQYPSVGLAYSIAISSYEMSVRRLDAQDSRLQTVLAFIISVSATVPPLASSRGVNFHSYWFYLAIAAFVLSAGVGVCGRLTGKVKIISPKALFNDWLHKPEWEFKKDFIAFAGDDFQHNLGLTELKWRFTVAISFLFFVEVGFLVAWVVGNS